MKRNKEDCVQNTPIALLTKDNKIMALNLKNIKDDVKGIKGDIREIKDFILLSPQNFPSKKEFESLKKETEVFKNGINTKIAFASGGFAVAVSIVSFFLNKYL